jgi:GrpB-like predicted nucleotidyltransferase (UPF0157 family)
VAIEHIGSTAIPDLMSKPTIDILIGVNEFNDRSFFISEITSLGYHYIAEYEVHLPNRKYFEKISQLKQALAHMERKNRNDYASAKTAFIKKMEDEYYPST